MFNTVYEKIVPVYQLTLLRKLHLSYYKVYNTFPDVAIDNIYVVITVWALMFMVKSNGMNHFMQSARVVAALSKSYLCSRRQKRNN